MNTNPSETVPNRTVSGNIIYALGYAVCRFYLLFIFLVAGAEKLAHPLDFISSLSSSGLIPWPTPLTPVAKFYIVFSTFIPVLEIVIALVLFLSKLPFTPLLRIGAFSISLCLSIMFTIFHALRITGLISNTENCGCFGAFELNDWSALLLTATMIVASFYALWYTAKESSAK
jgi:hypothetical protein